jgi:Uma2 family endonuclease
VARVAERSQMVPEEYLAWERQQEQKHEYFEGEVYAMAGGSPRHNRLSFKVGVALESALGGRCHVLSSDQRVRSRERRYVYPDVSVVCGAPVIEHGDVLVNPMIVVEVLSSTTEQYDRGLKWNGYQALPSLTDYVLVSQDRAHIEHFGRTPDGRWVYTSANAGERIVLTEGTVLDIDAIFAGVLELPAD